MSEFNDENKDVIEGDGSTGEQATLEDVQEATSDSAVVLNTEDHSDEVIDSDSEKKEEGAAEDATLDAGDSDESNAGEAPQEVETATYKITGPVDKFDEQMNIVGQYQIDSIQRFPVSVGDAIVADGRAEKVEE